MYYAGSYGKEWGDEFKASISGCYGRKCVMNVGRKMFACGQKCNPVQLIPGNLKRCVNEEKLKKDY